ncbi:MAG: SurA N-terminal domain-containing protein [Chloroflexota bacterium]
MKRLSFLSIALALLIVAACSRNPITVDGQSISRETFDAVLKQRMQQHKTMDAKVDEAAIKKSVADELVAEILIAKAAAEKNITVTDADVQKAVEQMRGKKSEQEFKEEVQKAGMPYNIFLQRLKSQMIVSKFLADLVKEDSVTEEDMKEFYSKNRDALFSPQKVFVKILHLKDEAEAKKIDQRLEKGENFETLADSLAKDGKAQTTDYGWLEPGFLSKEIAEAMATAPLNTVQGPYKGKDGTFYFFKLKERSRQALSFNDAKAQIKNMILAKKRQELATHLVETQKKKAKIELNI